MPFMKKPPTWRENVEWKNIVVGGGGLLLHVEISQDGETILTNCDIDGMYLFNGATDTWDCLSRTNTMLFSYLGSRYPGFAQNSSGFTAVCIAPSNSDIIYAIWRPAGLANKDTIMIKSVDRGATWTRCEGYNHAAYANAVNGGQVLGSNTTPEKAWWRKIGIDPSNPDVIYAPFPATGGKPVMSVDGGQTFTAISGLPTQVVSTIGAGFFAIDPSSAISGGRHQRIICYMAGDGFYETTDGGTNWTEIYSYTATTFSDGGAFGPDGVFYVGINGVGVLRYQDSTITNIKSATAGQNIHVAVHPTIAGKIATCNGDAIQLAISTNHGTSFTNYNTETSVTYSCPTVGWQAAQIDALKFSSGQVRQIAWNPGVAHEIWVCHSQGISRGVMNGSDNPSFVAHVLGTETCIGNWIYAPPNSDFIVLATWDEAGFIKTKSVEGLATPPLDRHGPSTVADYGDRTNIWAFDADPQDPMLVACAGFLRGNSTANCGNGYSTDGGETWIDFATFPAVPTGAGAEFRQVCVNDGVMLYHYVYNSSGNVYPYRSTNNGATWTALTAANFSGHPGTSWGGFGAGNPVQYRPFCADSVDPDVFYGLNLSSTAGKRGFWKSTDRGQNFTNVNDELGNTITSMRHIHAAPDNEGHVFIIPLGSNAYHEGMNISTGSSAGTSVYRTIDGGTNIDEWSSDIKMVSGFGFGKARAPGLYPTIYFAGHYKGDWGVFRVENDDLSTIVQYWDDTYKNWPLGHGAGGNWVVQMLTGDPDIFGRVYVAFGSRGFVYADLA
jgi:hypothetical protein